MNKRLVGMSLLASVLAAPSADAQGITGDLGKRIEVGVFGQYTKLDDVLNMKSNVPSIGGLFAMQVWKAFGVEVNGNVGKTESTRTPFEKMTYSPWRALGTAAVPLTGNTKLMLGAGYLQSIYNGRSTANEYEDGFAGLVGLKVCGSGKWGARADGILDYNPSPNEQALTGTSKNYSVRIGATYALRGTCGDEQWTWALKIDPASATVNRGATKPFALSAVDYKGKTIALNKIKDLACTTADASIATVTNGAVATGVKYGTTTITCSGTQRKIRQSVSANVTVPPPEWRLELTPTSGATDVGKTLSFSSKAVDADNVDLGAITWSSANPAIASVSNGVVTCNAAGTTTITVTKSAYGSSKTASASVECKPLPEVPSSLALTERLFGFDNPTFTLTKEARDSLKVVVEALRKVDTLRISIEGHTDWYASEAYNNALAKKRAAFVRGEILKMLGKDRKQFESRIFSNSYGEQCHVTEDGATEPEPPPANRGRISPENKAAQSANRRVEVWQLRSSEQTAPTSCRPKTDRAGRVPFGKLIGK